MQIQNPNAYGITLSFYPAGTEMGARTQHRMISANVRSLLDRAMVVLPEEARAFFGPKLIRYLESPETFPHGAYLFDTMGRDENVHVMLFRVELLP